MMVFKLIVFLSLHVGTRQLVSKVCINVFVIKATNPPKYLVFLTAMTLSARETLCSATAQLTCAVLVLMINLLYLF